MYSPSAPPHKVLHTRSESPPYPIWYTYGMEKETGKKIVLWVAVAIVVGIAAGYSLGTTVGYATGRSAADTQLSGIVNSVFPKPPSEIHQIAGTVKAIVGATLTLEVNDPSDYLPHVDGTPQKKMARYASLMGSTKIVLIDSTKTDAQGNPLTSTLAPSDLKVGDNVMVKSDQNIAATPRFDVTNVQLVKY